MELFAAIPFGPIYLASTSDPDLDFVQDILVLKLLRLHRFLGESPLEQALYDVANKLLSRD